LWCKNEEMPEYNDFGEEKKKLAFQKLWWGNLWNAAVVKGYVSGRKVRGDSCYWRDEDLKFPPGNYNNSS